MPSLKIDSTFRRGLGRKGRRVASSQRRKKLEEGAAVSNEENQPAPNTRRHSHRRIASNRPKGRTMKAEDVVARPVRRAARR